MNDGLNGYVMFGIGEANSLTSVNDAIAGRDPNLASAAQYPDLFGNNWYQFYIYTRTSGQVYVGTAGNYTKNTKKRTA
jgi:hypothetical protein